jgi:hypothetical protein
MVEFVSFKSSKLGKEFIIDKIVSSVFVSMTENQGVAQMHSVGKEIRNRKKSLNLMSSVIRNIFAKVNERFLKVRGLTRLTTEVI